jgi:hypothetical protein
MPNSLGLALRTRKDKQGKAADSLCTAESIPGNLGWLT